MHCTLQKYHVAKVIITPPSTCIGVPSVVYNLHLDFDWVCMCVVGLEEPSWTRPRAFNLTDWPYSLNGVSVTSGVNQRMLNHGESAPMQAKIEGLPTELLLSILELAISRENPPELFCIVSRRWYRSVVTCATFWRYIDITLECYLRMDRAMGLVPSVRRHMIRSRTCELNVTIDYGSGCPWDSQFWDAVVECAGLNGGGMRRWSTLKLMYTNNIPFETIEKILGVFQYPTPQLRELSICVSRGLDMTHLFPHAPLLRVLRVPSATGTITWPPTFRRLVSTLYVNNSQSFDTSDLLRNVPSIQSLHLGSTVFTRSTDQGETIELLQLRELHASVPDFPCVLPSMYLPCLTHLTLTCRPRRCPNPFVVPDTCETYGPILARIENLTILRMGCSTADDLIQLLAHSPRVLTLEMQACGRWVGEDDLGRWLRDPVLVEEFYSVLEMKELCPLLSHCRLNGVDRSDLVELRRRPTS